MNAISLITRKADTSRDSFRHDYEGIHCHLAMRNFPYQRCTPNYLKADAIGLDFDCISEFKMVADFDSRNLMSSPARKLLMDDERQFMQPENTQVALEDETVLLNHSDATSSGSLSRCALLFARSEMELLEFRHRVEASAEVLSWNIGTLQSLSLDLLQPVTGSDLPVDAVVWMQTIRPCTRIPYLEGFHPD